MTNFASTTDARLEDRISAIRRFNRFYSQRFEVLNESLLQTNFSLTEARVLFELANREEVTATELARDLRLDMGYLSRILRNFEDGKLIEKSRSTQDGRQSVLSITRKGRSEFKKLDQQSRDQLATLLASLDEDQQQELQSALLTVQRLLSEESKPQRTITFRSPDCGDYGWIIERHGALYAREYGWNERFEALVAEIVASYIQNFDTAHDRCWIAEVDGVRAGCAFVVNAGEGIAKLRLLLVEPQFRRLGIASQLIEECLRFAKQAGYKRAIFWTNNVLKDARRIYDRMGFTLIAEEKHRRFGPELTGQTFEMILD